MPLRGVSKTKKIFIGGIPISLTEGKNIAYIHIIVHSLQNLTMNYFRWIEGIFLFIW